LDSRQTDGRIRIDRNEIAGAFGDIGTDLPLIIGMAFATGAPGGHLHGDHG